MGKYKTGLMKQIIEETTAAEVQQTLHAKHHIEDPNVVVVEKRSILKFTVRTVAAVIRTVAFLLLILLAVVGLVSLVYPAPRDALLGIWNDTVRTVNEYVHTIGG